MKRFILFLVLTIITGCQPTKPSEPTQNIAVNTKAAAINASAGAEYIRLGKYKSALGKLKRALAQDPSLPEAHNMIAVLYNHLGDNKKAEYHYKQAIVYAPNYSEVHNNYGVFLCEQARYSQAEEHFLKAISDPLYPNSAQAYENLGLCVDKIPDATLAEKYLRTALQLDPYLRKALLKMADLSYQNIDYLTARAYIERYRQVSNWTPKALLLAIKIENKLGAQDKVSSYSVLLKGKFPDSEEALELRRGQY